MAGLPWFLEDVAQRFEDNHPFWSHRQNIPPQVYDARRAQFDARTGTRAALVKTSYPAPARPAPAVGHIANPPMPTNRTAFPTSWDAFTRPVWTAQTYAKALPQRLALYAHDPVAGVTADFQDIRRHNRFADLVGRALEDEVSKTPVLVAKAADFVADHAPSLPYLNGSDPGFPGPRPQRRKLAPLAEQMMRPMLDDAALRPPTNSLEQSVDGVTRAATFLGAPETAAVEAAPRAGVVFGGLVTASRDLRAGLRAGKTWDQAFGDLSKPAQGTLSSFWLRAGRGKTGDLEQAAAWGDDAASKRFSANADQPIVAPVVPPPASPIPTIGGRKPINSRYAGHVHPSGVEFTDQGFPAFEPNAVAKVQVDGLTGNHAIDEALANREAKFPKTPPDHTWRHVEDTKTMLLVPTNCTAIRATLEERRSSATEVLINDDHSHWGRGGRSGRSQSSRSGAGSPALSAVQGICSQP